MSLVIINLLKTYFSEQENVLEAYTKLINLQACSIRAGDMQKCQEYILTGNQLIRKFNSLRKVIIPLEQTLENVQNSAVLVPIKERIDILKSNIQAGIKQNRMLLVREQGLVKAELQKLTTGKQKRSLVFKRTDAPAYVDLTR